MYKHTYTCRRDIKYPRFVGIQPKVTNETETGSDRTSFRSPIGSARELRTNFRHQIAQIFVARVLDCLKTYANNIY